MQCHTVFVSGIRCSFYLTLGYGRLLRILNIVPVYSWGTGSGFLISRVIIVRVGLVRRALPVFAIAKMVARASLVNLVAAILGWLKCIYWSELIERR